MRKLLTHGCFWLLFFLMWDQIMYFYMSNTANRLYFTAIDISLVLATFYTLYAYLLPAYLKHKSLIRLLLQSALVVMVSAALFAYMMKLMLNHMLMPIHFDLLWNYSDLQYNRFFIALVGVLGGAFVKLAIDRLESQRRIARLEKESTIAELTYLKAQVNPHFLFNALNGLYTQLDFNTAAAKETLIAIADLLRYQLYECDAELIPVEKELAYLKNYFGLQQMRNDNCRASLVISGNPDGLAIAPLLLIPFVENAFKHLSDNEKENSVDLAISLAGKKLRFDCRNTFDEEDKLQGNRGGLGLLNVRKRLGLLYPNRYRLELGEVGGLYIVNLCIDLS